MHANPDGVVVLMVLLWVGFVFVVFLPTYFLPTIIGAYRGVDNLLPLAIINFVFGWTLLGWAGCLAWAFKDQRPEIVHVHHQYERDPSPPPVQPDRWLR